VRHRRLALAVAVLGLIVSPASLWAQEIAPPDEPPAVPAEPVPPPEPEPADEGADTPVPDEPTEPAEPAPDPAEPPPVTEPAPAAAPAPRQSGATVSMLDFSYSPASIQINQGGSVTWVNNGEEPHTSTGDGFDTGEIASGASGSITFSSSGNFSYFCTLHPNMTGTVRVLAVDDGSDGGDTGGVDPGEVPGPTEAAAVAAPPVDGDLPATGDETGLLAAVGLLLLALGLELFAAGRLRPR
jgi:LPXTG-motif cell wall-anchored protein